MGELRNVTRQLTDIHTGDGAMRAGTEFILSSGCAAAKAFTVTLNDRGNRRLVRSHSELASFSDDDIILPFA